MGARYTNDPAIVAVNMASFANHNTQDWNIQDTVGNIVCPRCPQPPPTLCGTIAVDQPSQWLAAGWTEPTDAPDWERDVRRGGGSIPQSEHQTANRRFGHNRMPLLAVALTPLYAAISRIMFTETLRWEYRLDLMPTDFTCSATQWPPIGRRAVFTTLTPLASMAEPYIKYMIRAHAHPNLRGLLRGRQGCRWSAQRAWARRQIAGKAAGQMAPAALRATRYASCKPRSM